MVAALQSDALGVYAGNVWFLQPPPSDLPWRPMSWDVMTLRELRCQPDPTTGYPLNFVRDGIPSITGYAVARAFQAQTPLITPWSTVRVRLRRVGFAQISCRARLYTRGGDQRQERRGFCGRHGFVYADCIFSQPFWPAGVSAERMAKASYLTCVSRQGLARVTWIWPGLSCGISTCAR